MNKILFQNRLREIRLMRGYHTQAQLAEAYNKKYNPDVLNTSGILGSIKKWESGKSIPTIEKLSNLCDLLNCDVNYLLGKIDCTSYKSSEFKLETGLSEITYEKLKELYTHKKEILQIDLNAVTELDVLENILTYHNGYILKTLWYRILRNQQYPTQTLKTSSMAGVGDWVIYPDDLRKSDNMELYNSLIEWIDKYHTL